MESDQNQDGRKDQEQPVLLARHLTPVKSFQISSQSAIRRSKTHIDRAEPAKKVQWPRHITQKESDCHEIEEHPESTRYVVMGLPVLPMIVLNGYFTDRGSVGRSNCRDESVHFAIER